MPSNGEELLFVGSVPLFYVEADGLDWQNGTHDYTSYYLPEVVRRNRNSTNPANQALAKTAEPLLDYLKDVLKD